ncbi:MAG: LuxR family transcriptional regulator [Pararhodobacter sp.]|nr:LuxR family transcriptional regulator [Pararhodobacter sp.]
MADVGEAILRRTRPLGFDTYVVGTMPPPDDPSPTPFTVDNLAPRFWEVYLSQGMAERDPTFRAINMAGAPVSFSDIREGEGGFVPHSDELAVLELAASCGQPHGLVVPIYRAQGYRGLVALTGPGPDPVGAVRAVLRFLAEHAHDRMRQLFVPANSGNGPILSARETELMALARRGLSDEEIAVASGISVRTVRFHFDNVRRKFQARSRSEALATAINLHLLPP